MSEAQAADRESVQDDEDASVRLETSVLSTYLDYIDPIADEFRWSTSAEGFETQVVDAANVAMTSASLPEQHIVDGSLGDATLGVNRSRLADIVSMAGDEISLRLDQETRKLVVESDGLEFTMGLIDPSTIRQEPDLPDLDEQWVAEVVIPARKLQQAAKATELVSNHVSIGADPEDRTFTISASGDTDDVEWVFSGDDLIEADVDEACESRFSLDYVEPMVKAFSKDVAVTLRFGSEVPISMRAAAECGRVEYMLAPRIDANNGGGR